MEERIQNALVGFGAGLLGGAQEMIERDILLEAEEERSKRMTDLKLEEDQLRASSGFVDSKTGQPVSNYQLNKMKDKSRLVAQSDWARTEAQKNAEREAAIKQQLYKSPGAMAQREQERKETLGLTQAQQDIKDASAAKTAAAAQTRALELEKLKQTGKVAEDARKAKEKKAGIATSEAFLKRKDQHLLDLADEQEPSWMGLKGAEMTEEQAKKEADRRTRMDYGLEVPHTVAEKNAAMDKIVKENKVPDNWDSYPDKEKEQILALAEKNMRKMKGDALLGGRVSEDIPEPEATPEEPKAMAGPATKHRPGKSKARQRQEALPGILGQLAKDFYSQRDKRKNKGKQ